MADKNSSRRSPDKPGAAEGTVGKSYSGGFYTGAQLAGRLHVLGGYRWLKFTLVGEPDEKVANELFAGVRWQLR